MFKCEFVRHDALISAALPWPDGIFFPSIDISSPSNFTSPCMRGIFSSGTVPQMSSIRPPFQKRLCRDCHSERM